MLKYLESEQMYLPKDISVDQKRLIRQELKYWSITSLDYELATSANFLNAERLLSKEPEI